MFTVRSSDRETQYLPLDPVTELPGRVPIPVIEKHSITVRSSDRETQCLPLDPVIEKHSIYH